MVFQLYADTHDDRFHIINKVSLYITHTLGVVLARLIQMDEHIYDFSSKEM